jgi:hypothetical protein
VPQGSARRRGAADDQLHGGDADLSGEGDIGGTWYWLRSPEEEKRVAMALFTRYCIRYHGPDGRGNWDISGFPIPPTASGKVRARMRRLRESSLKAEAP